MISNEIIAEILNYVGSNDNSLTSYGTHYYALMSVIPGTGGGGVEASGVSRVSVTNNTTNYPTVTAGQNAKWLQAAVQWTSIPVGTWKGFAIYSASSGGTLIGFAAFNEGDITTLSGDSITMAAGSSVKFEIATT